MLPNTLMLHANENTILKVITNRPIQPLLAAEIILTILAYFSGHVTFQNVLTTVHCKKFVEQNMV